MSFQIAAIFFLAGLTQGVTGFGAALVAIPLLCLVTDIKIAVPLCVLNSIVITTFLFFQMKRYSDPAKIIPLCVGSLPGVVTGATLLKSVDSGTMRLFLGILLIGYSSYSLLFTRRTHRLHRAWAWPAGFTSGALGAAFSAGGPPAIIYTTHNGWDKNEIKATLTCFFLFNSCIVAVTHAVSGMTTLPVLSFFIVSAPSVFIGTYIGSVLFRFLPDKDYMKIIFTFLIIMGIMMIFN